MKITIVLSIIGIVLALNGLASAFVKYHQITGISWPKKSFLHQERDEDFTSHLDNLKEQYNELFQEFCKK